MDNESSNTEKLDMELIKDLYWLKVYEKKINVSRDIEFIETLQYSNAVLDNIKQKERINVVLVKKIQEIIVKILKYKIDSKKTNDCNQKQKNITQVLRQYHYKIANGAIDTKREDEINCFLTNLTEESQIDSFQLENIEIVWGNLDFSLVDSLPNMPQLRIVAGDAELSNFAQLHLPSLQAVFGSLHIEKLESLEGLSNIGFVSGMICYQDKVYEGSEWKELLNASIQKNINKKLQINL
ncbi:MAG: hypothetical protein PHN72_06905 [Bacilli bacterium]|nr:hypothetical protein [Bacilli bacterium]